jgi:hypothetical protein
MYASCDNRNLSERATIYTPINDNFGKSNVEFILGKLRVPPAWLTKHHAFDCS